MTSPASFRSLRATITSQSGAQAAAALVSMAQVFMLTPWYLREFGPGLYGAWAASGEIFYWLQTLELGLPNILIQRIAACTAEQKPAEAGRWFGSGALTMAGLGFALTLIGWGLAAPAASWLGVDPVQRGSFLAAFRLGAAATGLTIFAYVFIALARGLQRARYMNAGQVAGALASFAVTAASLQGGAGLVAIPLGMSARAAVFCCFGMLAFLRETPAELRRHAAPDTAMLGGLARLAPSTATGSAAYAAANQSDTVLAAVLLGPAAAALLAVNRRLFDAIRLVADSLPQTSTGAFAFRTSQAGPEEGLRLARQLSSFRTFTILPLAASALALNRWFVGVWTGPQWDGGPLLCGGLAAAVYFGGHSYLANALLRSTGRFRESAWLLAAEAAGRWLSLAAAAWLGGLSWMPWAGAALAGAAAAVNRRRLAAALQPASSTAGRPRVFWTALPLSAAACLCIWTPPWTLLFALSAAIALATAGAQLLGDPWLSPAREFLRGKAEEAA